MCKTCVQVRAQTSRHVAVVQATVQAAGAGGLAEVEGLQAAARTQAAASVAAARAQAAALATGEGAASQLAVRQTQVTRLVMTATAMRHLMTRLATALRAASKQKVRV